MRHRNIRSFLETLRRESELHVIEVPVDPDLELAEIQRRVVAHEGPALLFTNVTGSKFPVATNLFGTRRRIELAFGEDPERFFRRVAEAVEILAAPSVSKLWEFRDIAKTALRLGTRRLRSGPVIECVMNPPRLKDLPQIRSWPMDGGAFLTLPLVYTEHPLTGKPNLGMYRNQIFDDRVAGMHFQIHRGLGFHYHEAEKMLKPLPANIFLGGPPALIMSAIAPLPENVPEAVLASLLQGQKLEIIRDERISRLPVVAEAEFALIGQIPCEIRRTEGPFGDHYGYYSLAHPYPVFEAARVYHRKDAIFPATVVGRPRQEDHYIGEYLQDLFSPLYPLVMNGVERVWAYDDAGVHTLASAVVKERYRKEAFMAAMRILGEGQLSLTKFLLVTDARLPLRDFRPLLTHILERADFSSDLFVFSPVSQDTLDYTSNTINEGSKAVLMGLGDRRFTLQAELRAELKDPIFRTQKLFSPGVLVVEGPAWRENDGVIARLLEEEAVQPFRMVFLVDSAHESTESDESFLWTVFTRFEPAADIHARETRLERFHVQLSSPVAFDCRMKPWYPPALEPLPETIARVDRLWPAIFGDGGR
ncbi:MAG: UbiD family decarboxylase [Acidobacteria bacterium]|nr:UbiD family decarboxylase [Acidobacteriota bacterium]